MKTYATPIAHHVIAAPASGDTPLKTAIQAIGTLNTGAKMPVPSWTGSRLNYTSWAVRMAWDEVAKKIWVFEKPQNGAAGALHSYDAATDIWTQVWAGYVAGNTNLAHPYCGWALNPQDQSIWMVAWQDGALYRYQGTANTNANWELRFTPPNVSTVTPNALGFIKNFFGAGQVGLVLATRSSSTRGRIQVMKDDGTSAVTLFTGNSIGTGEALNFYEPLAYQVPSLNGVLVVAGNGWPQVAGVATNNPDARAAGRSVGMWLITGTSSAPVVRRLPDPPSVRVNWTNSGTLGDKLAVVGSNVYLFGKDDRQIWSMSLASANPSWVQLSTQHAFDPGNFHNNVTLIGIDEYGGVVCLNDNETSASENRNGVPYMAVHKTTALAGAGADTTPNAFTFLDQTGVAVSSPITSAAIVVTGINAAAAISITGGTYSINGGSFTSSPGTVVNNDSVVVRHTSSGSQSTAVNTVLTIGGVSDTFTSTTAGPDTTPDAFTFTPQTGVAVSTLINSNSITVAGITAAAAITVSGGFYRINGGSWVATSGTVNNGDTVECRVTSSAVNSTAKSATVTIGGVSSTFTVTTVGTSANYWDFSTLIPPAITGWTPYSLSSTWQYGTVAGVSGATGAGGNVMRETANGAASNAHQLHNDAVGIVDGTAHTVEILCRFKTRSAENAPGFVPVIIFSNTTDDAGYGLYFPSATQVRGCRYSTSGSYAASLGSAAGNLGFTLAADTWYWARFRRETNGVFKGSVWAGLVSDEPGSWQFTMATGDATITSGNLGLRGNSHQEEKDIDVVSFGIDATAPSA